MQESGGSVGRIVAEALSWVGHAISASGRAQGRRLRLPGAAYRCLAAVYGAAPEAARTLCGRLGRGGRRRPLSGRGAAALPRKAAERNAARAICSCSAGAPHLPAKHAAILISPDRFVHAYEGSAVVVIDAGAAMEEADRGGVCVSGRLTSRFHRPVLDTMSAAERRRRWPVQSTPTFMAFPWQFSCRPRARRSAGFSALSARRSAPPPARWPATPSTRR